MDNESESNTWIGNIFQKFEAISLEDTFKNVEGQLQTVGDSVIQFFSELGQDVLLPSSVDIQREQDCHLGAGGNTKVTDYQNSTVDIDAEHIKEQPCRVDQLLDSSSVESSKSMGIGLSLEKNVDIGMTVKPEGGFEEVPHKEEQVQNEISDIGPPGDRDPMEVLLSPHLQADKDISIDCRAKILLPSPDDVEGSNTFLKAGEAIDACACESGDISSSDSVSLVGSCENQVTDAELCCDDTSAWSIERFKRFIKEESGSDDITQQGIQTLQSCDMVKLDESWVMVERNELQSHSCEASKDKSYKKNPWGALASKVRLVKDQSHKQHATCYEDVNAGLDQQRGKSSKLSIDAK